MHMDSVHRAAAGRAAAPVPISPVWREADDAPVRRPGHLRPIWDAGTSACGRRAGFEALGALSVGVFVVAADASVRLGNTVAGRLAQAGIGIAVRQGRLALSDLKLDERLRSAIQRAGLAPPGRSLFAGETIVARSRDGAPLSLMVIPLPPDAAPHGPAEALAVVFIGDPAGNAEPSMELVRAAYGLTPAETRVLFAIVGGQRPGDYAEAAGLSHNTVQTQLKALFAKTGCHRQIDLVRKVLSDPLLRLAQNLGR